jgi:hypothetical protein
MKILFVFPKTLKNEKVNNEPASPAIAGGEAKSVTIIYDWTIWDLRLNLCPCLNSVDRFVSTVNFVAKTFFGIEIAFSHITQQRK